MKKAAIILLILIVLGIAFLGGVWHQEFTRYLPSAPEAGVSESVFKLKIHPEFTSGGTSGSRAIPLLFYIEREPSADPHIILRLTPDNPADGYAGKKSVTLTSLRVNNERGEIFELVRPRRAEDFPINNSGYGSTRWDFGPITGERVSISAEGFVLTNAGEIQKFTYQRNWAVVRSSRLGLGIFLSE